MYVLDHKPFAESRSPRRPCPAPPAARSSFGSSPFPLQHSCTSELLSCIQSIPISDQISRASISSSLFVLCTTISCLLQQHFSQKNKSYHSPSPTSSRRPQYADDRFPGQPCRLFVPPFFLFSHWSSPSFLRFQANHQQQKAYGVTERRHRLWTWTSRITSASRPLDTKTSCKNASRDQTAPAASVFDHNDYP
ncbi:hypothetical protein IWZ01DRAFT_7308 [Phyllosticta capitalensis]